MIKVDNLDFIRTKNFGAANTVTKTVKRQFKEQEITFANYIFVSRIYKNSYNSIIKTEKNLIKNQVKELNRHFCKDYKWPVST